MEMDDCACPADRFVERPVQKHLLGGRIAGQMCEAAIELGDACRVEEAQARIGRGDQETICEGGADVSGGTHRESALIERGRTPYHELAQLSFGHVAASSRSSAFSKKSSVPKFPDLS